MGMNSCRINFSYSDLPKNFVIYMLHSSQSKERRKITFCIFFEWTVVWKTQFQGLENLLIQVWDWYKHNFFLSSKAEKSFNQGHHNSNESQLPGILSQVASDHRLCFSNQLVQALVFTLQMNKSSTMSQIMFSF
jgi:hypothetical protein